MDSDWLTRTAEELAAQSRLSPAQAEHEITQSLLFIHQLEGLDPLLDDIDRAMPNISALPSAKSATSWAAPTVVSKTGSSRSRKPWLACGLKGWTNSPKSHRVCAKCRCVSPI